MAANEIKESHNEVSRIVKKPVENIYGLASLLRVFFARCIDLLIAAIPPVICIWAWRPSSIDVAGGGTPNHADWVYTIVQLAIGLASILIFFVVIPSFTKGTTIGKALCGIRLRRSKGDKKVKWYMLLARESFFLVVPWAIALICKCIALAVLLNSSHDESSTGAQIINQLGFIFYFLWFIFLLVTIKAQDEHQSGIDMHFGLYVVYKEPIKQITKEVEVKERSLILTDEPGNLSKDNLDELRNDEKRKFDKSISLEDLDIAIEQQPNKKEDTKKIENKNNKKNKGDKK